MSNKEAEAQNNGSTDNEEPEEEHEDNDEEEDEDEEEEEDSDEEEVAAAEPLATTRSRRPNAGNLMSKMIQDEEDEFYSNLYGGFHEEDDDGDFDDEEEADNEDVEDDYDVDSDFSIDETDEIAPEHQVVDEEPKKKRGVYKDPKPKGHVATPQTAPSGPSRTTPAQPRPKPSFSGTPQSPSKIRGERSFRDSTRKKTEETIKNIQTGKRKKKKKNRNLEAWRQLTQEEMLEEAKVTEEENLKSLEIYQRLESEKLSKIKQIKKTLPTPYVTYYSTTMPIIDSNKRYSRNFLTFIT